MRICPSCSESNTERARFCQACGTPLPEAAGAGGEVRKVVTIVFADMAGSTGIGERLDPEALRRVQSRYFDALTAAVEAHGGTVEKYIGDAVMVVFGIPRLHEDDALRAVRSAAAMREAVETLNDSLERDHGVRIAIRIGINTGEVVAGDPSAGQRLVTGDTVNVAARFEQAATPGEILIGAPTYRLIRDAVEVEQVEALELRGKARPVAAYRLLTVLADLAGHVRNLDSSMVGRMKELDLIRRSLERARAERTSHLFTLLGTAGVGKSRLIREFLAGIDDATVLRGRCLSYGEGTTYHALADVVRQAAGIAGSDDPATATGKLVDLLADADDHDRIVRHVGGMFGWEDPSSAEDASWAMRRSFEHIARDRPVVLVIDDIHWAEPLLLDLIESLADWTRDAMLLILCVARPELLEIRPGWGGGKLNAMAILLEPLAADDASELLENLLGGANLPRAVHDRILAAAEGNPLFVEEMLGMLIDDGLLRQEDGGWRAVADMAELTVPPTIQLLLAARLDRLDAEERAVIERGAVEGKVFHTGAIYSLTPEALRPQVRPRLLALARKELIRPDRAEFAGEDAFRFRHVLIRDAAYQALPKEQRADLHERFARWLITTTGDRVSEYGEIVGYHLEQAYRYRAELGPIDERASALALEAGRTILASAQRTLLRADVAATTRLLERAIGLLDGTEKAEATVELGEHLVWVNDEARAVPMLRAFLGSAGAGAWPALAIRAQVFLTMAEVMTDPGRSQEAALRATRDLLVEAEALDDEEAITACLLGVGRWAFWMGRTGEQREIAERLLPGLDRLRPIYREWISSGFGTDAQFGSTPVDEGLANLEICRRINRDSVMGSHAADVVSFSLLVMADRTFEADAILVRILTMKADLHMLTHVGDSVLAEGLWRRGRQTEAIDVLRTLKADLDSRGDAGFNSTSTAELATLLGQSGWLNEAQEMIDDAWAMAAIDDFMTWAAIGRATATVALGGGDLEAALDAVDPAIELLRSTDHINLLADTVRLRGEILVAAGRTSEAAESLDEATCLFDRKGNVADARHLREWQAAHGDSRESRLCHDMAMTAARPARIRLDQLLVDRGLAGSRSRAQALVLAGKVRVGEGDASRSDRKAGDLVTEDAPVSVTAPDPYVSRGGYKLAAALDAFGIDPRDLVALDVGASTGGFTDVLLQRGASRVYALDVGRGQLADSLQRDPRVVSMERTNARDLTATTLPEPVDLVTIDVSFISLDKVLGPIASALRSGPNQHIVALVKPQFEAGKGRTDHGVVRDPAIHREVLDRAVVAARAHGLGTRAIIASPITGPEGNREFLVDLAAGPSCAEIDNVIANVTGASS